MKFMHRHQQAALLLRCPSEPDHFAIRAGFFQSTLPFAYEIIDAGKPATAAVAVLYARSRSHRAFEHAMQAAVAGGKVRRNLLSFLPASSKHGCALSEPAGTPLRFLENVFAPLALQNMIHIDVLRTKVFAYKFVTHHRQYNTQQTQCVPADP